MGERAKSVTTTPPRAGLENEDIGKGAAGRTSASLIGVVRGAPSGDALDRSRGVGLVKGAARWPVHRPF